MQVSDVATKFFRPEATAPFVNLYRLTPKAGILKRNPPHYHPDTFEIFAVYHGHLDWTVGEETHSLRPGDFILVPTNVVHGAVDANLQVSKVIALHIAPDELPDDLARALESLAVTRTRDPSVLDLVRRVFDEHRRKTPLLSSLAPALAALLISTLVDLSKDEERLESSRLVRRAQKALMEKYGTRPTVNEVADRLGVSAVWLTRCFIRETGASPGDWARSKRIFEAKQLLADGKLTTSDIAFELGYSSGQVLATAFRKECGMTPTEYRALHQSREPSETQEPDCYSMRIYYEDRDEVVGDDN